MSSQPRCYVPGCTCPRSQLSAPQSCSGLFSSLFAGLSSWWAGPGYATPDRRIRTYPPAVREFCQSLVTSPMTEVVKRQVTSEMSKTFSPVETSTPMKSVVGAPERVRKFAHLSPTSYLEETLLMTTNPHMYVEFDDNLKTDYIRQREHLDLTREVCDDLNQSADEEVCDVHDDELML